MPRKLSELRNYTSKKSLESILIDKYNAGYGT